VNRRQSMRFPLRAPVLLSWAELGEMRRGAGFTRDICTRATYVMWEHECNPPVGETVAVDILLPPLEQGGESLRFCGEGRVLRQGSGDEEPGFAVLVELAVSEPRRVA
jgi:hypothetical protein